MAEKSESKHFVLVHGFCHGAWCWYKLSVLLKSKGHRVTALDLGGCGVHPKQFQQISTVDDYVQPLTDFLNALPPDHDKAILVGHSYGGIPVALAMERFPEKIRLAVFVSAYMPNCMERPSALVQEIEVETIELGILYKDPILMFFKVNSTKSFMDTKFTIDYSSGIKPISGIMGPDYMAAQIYRKCSLEDLELAKMLIRPNYFFVDDLDKESLLTEERYGSISRVYVVCGDDEVMGEKFQRYNIEKSPPNDVFFIEGCGHMVMLSKPQDLCLYLQELAERY